MKKRLLIAFALALMVPWAARAQSMQDYSLSASNVTYTSFANADSLLSYVNGDGGTDTVVLPFNFPFGDSLYTAGTNMMVRADGYVYFGSTNPGHSSNTAWTSSTNYSLISPLVAYDGKITANGATSGAYKALQTDANGNPMLVIEFKGLMCYYSTGGNGDYNFQLRLHPDGTIDAIYGASTASGYSSMKHNFFLINGVGNKICLTGSWTEPVAGAPSSFPNLTGVPASGTMLTYTRSTCSRPANLALASLSANEASFGWTAGGTETEWVYSTDGEEWISVNTNSVVVDNLTDNTEYTFHLRAVCGVGDTSNANSVSFRTLCSAVDVLPWRFDPDSMASTSGATDIPCFTHLGGGYVNIIDRTGFTGYTVRFYPNSQSNPNILVLPNFSDDISSLYLTLVMAPEGTSSGSMDIGYVTSMDTSSFVPVANFPVSYFNGSGSVVPALVDAMFTDAPSGARIALRHNVNSTAWYWFIDELQVTTIPTCIRPDSCVVSNITTSSADLEMVSSNSDFLVYWHKVGSNLWDTLEVNGTTVTLQGLSMGDNYEGIVYSLCNGDTSLTHADFSFSASCSTITSEMLPFAEDFESYGSGAANPINGCWTKGTNSSTAYPYPSSTVVNGTRSLYMYGYHPSSGTPYYSWFALPQVDETLDMSTLMVDFLVKRGSTASNSNDTRVCVGIAESVTGLTSADVIDSVVTWIDTIDLFNEAANSIHEVEVAFTDYTGTGRYVVIYAPVPELHGSATYCYNYAYVDDITLRLIPTCYRPVSVVYTNVSTDEVTLSWTPDSRTPSPNSWNVEYGPEGFTPGEGTVESANDTTITLTNLTPNTAYDVYIVANCGGDVSDARQFAFRTLCTALEMLPYTQDFEDAETGSATSETFVPCLHRLNNGTQYFGYPYVSSTSGYNHTTGGSKGLYWIASSTTGTYGDYQIVAMPAVDTNTYPVNTLQLRFWARATSTSYHPVFQVGVMTNPFDASTFTPVQAVNVEGTTYAEYTVALGSYTGYGQYVAIRALRPSSTWNATIDDITLEEMPACPPITGIEARTTASSAVLTWQWQDGYEAPSAYVVTYDSVGGTNPGTVNVNTNTAIISGLAPLTTYKAYVQADCGSDGMGGMDSVEFTTGCIGQTEIDFSNSTTGTTGCIAYSLYGNTVYQALWTASELTAMGLTAGPITAIDLGFTSSTYAKEFTIFMKNTTTASISTATIETPGSQFYGPTAHPAGTEGWQHYVFDSAFVWDGTSNILMTTFMNQPTGTTQSSSTGLTGYYVSASNRARCRYKDSSPWTLSDLTGGTGGSTYSYRAAIHFYLGECTTDGCSAPSLMVTGVEATSVSLAWAPGADETSWNVDYRLVGDTAWTNAATGVSTTNYTVTGLQDGKSYEFRVSFTCSDNSLFASSATATTNCMAKPLPYTENFDGITTSTTAVNAGVMPPCWDYTLTGTSTYQAASYYPGVYYSANHATSGNYCLRLYGNGIFELPEMGASLDSLRLTFSDTITSTSYGLIVGVMDNGMFLPVDTLDLQTGVRNNVEVFFHNYTGNSRTIALVNYYTTSSTTYYSYHYIDDIVVDYIPVCAHVDSLTLDSISQTTATISWVPVNDETEWIVSDGTTTTSVNTTSHTFTGLTPNTPYTFEVRSVCGAGDTSEVYTVQGRTDCALLTAMPFFEDFESYASGNSSTTSPFIPCWTRLNNGTSYGGYPYVGNSTSYNHTLGGNKGLYWYGSTTTGTYGDYMYIILPEIDVTALPVNTLQLSFWAKSSSASYSPAFEVGVMNSNADTAFQVIDSFTINGNTEWAEFLVPFDSYTGNGSFVAIRAFRPTSSWYMYVDDISLDLIPACPRVEDVTASNVLTTSATISWTDTSSNSGWNIEYDTVAFTPGTNHMTAIHVTDTFAVLSGLDSATLYHVYVYPDCDGDVYFRHYTFTTLAASPATVPYVCDFEDEGTNGWDLINGSQTNRWMVGNAVNNGGNRSLYITNNDSSYAYTVSSTTYVFASRNITLAAGNYVCAFDWKAQGESSFDFIRAALVPASTQLIPGDYSGFNNTDAMPAGGIAVDGAYRLNLDSTWSTQVTEFQVTNADVYKLVFLWRTDASGGTQPPAAIDNVSLVVNTCPRVTDVIALPSANSIDLSWTPGSTETSWQVTVGTTTTVVNTPAYTATGLTPDSDYTVSIRAICGAGDTSFAVTDVYHTPCSAVSLPFSENFDALTTGNATSNLTVVPDCWNYILTGSASYQAASYFPGVYYSSSYSHSGSYCYRLYGEGYHMLPPMPTSLDSLQLTFWDYTTASYYGLEVGVMEGNTFVPVQTISTPTSTRTEHTVYFGSYTGSSRIIAFRNFYTTSTTSNYSYHYIDDVQVDYLPSCAPVYDIHAVSAGVDNIVVDWSDMTAGVSQWQVRYGVGNNTTTINATSHPVTISGLDSLTTYQVSVRPICSATDTGDWSAPVSLGTEMCDNASVAYTGQATGTANCTPVNNFYKYSLSETIIDSAELAGIGDISAIAYSYAHTTASVDKTNVTIWIQPTTKSVFTGSTDLILLDTTTAVQVYSGALNCSQGWNYFSLDTAYVWDGHSNLVVIVDDNSNEYDGSSYVFNTSNCTGYKTLAWYSDSQNPDPTSATFSGTKNYYQYRATMKLVSCSSVCREPVIDSAVADETSVTLTWNGNAASYEVYLVAGTWNEPTSGIAVTASPYTFTGLTPGTEYAVGVRAICDNGTSDWVTATVITDEHPCYTPTALTVTDVTLTSATLGWTPGEAETQWQLHVTGTNYDETITVNTNPYTLTGLTPAVTYSFTVSAVCSETQTSDPSEAETFTTGSCQPVSGVNVSNVTTNSAQVSWTAVQGVNGYEVEYGASGFNQGAGTTVQASTNSASLTGLTANMAYDVYVRSVCAEGVYSAWSSVTSFTTDEGEGIDDVNSAAIALYPNPATTTVTISGIEGQATVTVVDMNGRKNGEWRVENGEITLDLTGYAQGAYFVRIVGEQQNAIRKLIVK